MTGPFSATLLRLIESSSAAGSVSLVLLERDHAGVVPFPLDVEPGGLEDADDRLGDFRADAVAGNERDDVSHDRLRSSRRREPSRRDRFEQRAIGRAERRRAVAVDVDLAEDLAVRA